jgi:transglutaminase-like putative cysteine protease
MSVFKIHHITKYQYDRPVAESINEIRIFPFQCNEQELLQHDLIITNSPSVHVFKDYWGNKAGTFNILESHIELVIESKLIVRTVYDDSTLAQSKAEFSILFDQIKDDLQLIELIKPDSIQEQGQIEKIVAAYFKPNYAIKKIVEDCSGFIFNNYTYTKGITTIETTIDEILEHKQGVCQDFAHLLLQILRTIGIPCRYVSGYVCPNKNGMRGEGATHAWVEAWLPDAGWMGIDPTNNVWVSNHHVKLAVGRNFEDCSVVKGSFKGIALQDLYVFVSVGYEDGHIFEETTHVPMEKQISDQKIVELQIASAMAQQQ